MLNSLTADIVSALKSRPGTNVVVTAGNTFRSDDGVGPYVAAGLSVVPGINVIDAGYTPESIIDDVVALNPKYIVFIDAADFGGQPGEIKVICEDSVFDALVSTHMIPLPMVGRMIVDQIKADVSYIGIQVKTLEFGETLSPEVKVAGEQLIAAIKDLWLSGNSRE